MRIKHLQDIDDIQTLDTLLQYTIASIEEQLIKLSNLVEMVEANAGAEERIVRAAVILGNLQSDRLFIEARKEEFEEQLLEDEAESRLQDDEG